MWYDFVMDGVHDMGGMDGFGKIEAEKNEPVFHAAWEGRVLAIQRAMAYGRAWNIDQSRFAQERLPPITYLSASYYQRWLLGMEKNIVERGFATAGELKAGHAASAGKTLRRKLTVSLLQDALARPSYFRQQQAPALFKPGDRVRTRNIHPKTHTRLPRYARGKLGVVERCQGCHVYPDSVAVDRGDNPQWLYTVVFTGNELWGPDADPTVQVSIEAFEPYLESA
jgi:nitrile hydratase